jgi:hypothetical protein
MRMKITPRIRVREDAHGAHGLGAHDLFDIVVDMLAIIIVRAKANGQIQG